MEPSFLRWRVGFFILHLLFASGLFASADYATIQPLLGIHPVTHWNNDPRAGGEIEVVANEGGVGIRLTPLTGSSLPIPLIRLITDKESTTLTRIGNEILQEYVSSNRKVKIEYFLFDGFFELQATDCDADGICIQNTFKATQGKSTGEVVDLKDFFKSIQSPYQIEFVGGHVPNEGSNTADFDGESDPLEMAIYAPYCGSGNVCDPGYQPFPYAQTVGFKEGLGLGHTVVTLLVRKNEKFFHYSWEDKDGRVTLRNFQYQFMGGPKFCLEHVLHRK